ncbi:MAG: hypothetical protein SGJ19_07755 [Planctomycetia bacterium]|nr:hypothetical protein [Planctomycetia bacterium]
MKPRFSILTLLGVIVYIAFMLAFATSLPVVERERVVGRFGYDSRVEFFTKRRPPTSGEAIRRLAYLTVGVVPVVGLFLFAFRPSPDYPLISLRSRSGEKERALLPRSNQE